MALKPTFYIADFQSGDLHGAALPLEAVTLKSSLAPGSFQAQMDMRRFGSKSEARRVLNLLKYGRSTLVPVLEGVSTGIGNPPTSRALGEWWIARVNGSINDPIVNLSGPEFDGYLAHLGPVRDFKGTLDPVVTMRNLMVDAFTYSQNVVVNLQSWVSHTGAKVPVDIKDGTTDYWSEIASLAESEEGPFEWRFSTGLALSGWSPIRVTRTLQVGQPVLQIERPGVTLEVAAPGEGPASLLDATWDWDEARSSTNINSWGAGSGKDQVGPYHVGRSRASGEPGKSRIVTDRSALTLSQLQRTARRALKQFTPESRLFTARMPMNRYTPAVGEAYSWRNDATWTTAAKSGLVKVDGWSWKSSGPDVYDLDLVEV